MSGSEDSVSGAIAWLGFGDDHGYSSEVIEMFARHEYKIGRSDVLKMLGRNELSVSNLHITIRCVQFDDDLTWGVPPIIYAEDHSPNGTYLQRAQPSELGKGSSTKRTFDQLKGSIPVQHGDRLYLDRAKGIFIQIAIQVDLEDSVMSPTLVKDIKSFENDYRVTSQIVGTGGQGTVYVAVHQSTGEARACKVIPLKGTRLSNREASTILSQPDTTHSAEASVHVGEEAGMTSVVGARLCKLRNEYTILKDLIHPNIVTVERVFVTTHHICIMEELVTGGDLLSFMEHKNEQLREPQCAVIILQVLKAAEYLHAKNVVHRDIKPDNILMTSWKDGARVVLTDFGHARSMKSSHRRGAATRMFTTVGTLGYTAPEVHRLYTTLHGETGYSMAVDMWSIGTITALLMTGALIFPGNEGDESEQKLSKLRAAAKCDLSAIDQSKGRWALVTKRGKAFVKALLVLDEKKRLTATQALQHSWLSCAAYADELNTVYESAIENWRPRTTAGDVVHTDDNSASPVPPVHVRNKAVESTFFTEQHASAVHPASVSQRQYSTTPYSDNLLYNRKRWLKSKGALNISPDLGPDP